MDTNQFRNAYSQFRKVESEVKSAQGLLWQEHSRQSINAIDIATVKRQQWRAVTVIEPVRTLESKKLYPRTVEDLNPLESTFTVKPNAGTTRLFLDQWRQGLGLPTRDDDIAIQQFQFARKRQLIDNFKAVATQVRNPEFRNAAGNKIVGLAKNLYGAVGSSNSMGALTRISRELFDAILMNADFIQPQALRTTKTILLMVTNPQGSGRLDVRITRAAKELGVAEPTVAPLVEKSAPPPAGDVELNAAQGPTVASTATVPATTAATPGTASNGTQVASTPTTTPASTTVTDQGSPAPAGTTGTPTGGAISSTKVSFPVMNDDPIQFIDPEITVNTIPLTLRQLSELRDGVNRSISLLDNAIAKAPEQMAILPSNSYPISTSVVPMGALDPSSQNYTLTQFVKYQDAMNQQNDKKMKTMGTIAATQQQLSKGQPQSVAAQALQDQKSLVGRQVADNNAALATLTTESQLQTQANEAAGPAGTTPETGPTSQTGVSTEGSMTQPEDHVVIDMSAIDKELTPEQKQQVSDALDASMADGKVDEEKAKEAVALFDQFMQEESSKIKEDDVLDQPIPGAVAADATAAPPLTQSGEKALENEGQVTIQDPNIDKNSELAKVPQLQNQRQPFNSPSAAAPRRPAARLEKFQQLLANFGKSAAAAKALQPPTPFQGGPKTGVIQSIPVGQISRRVEPPGAKTYPPTETAVEMPKPAVNPGKTPADQVDYTYKYAAPVQRATSSNPEWATIMNGLLQAGADGMKQYKEIEKIWDQGLYNDPQFIAFWDQSPYAATPDSVTYLFGNELAPVLGQLLPKPDSTQWKNRKGPDPFKIAQGITNKNFDTLSSTLLGDTEPKVKTPEVLKKAELRRSTRATKGQISKFDPVTGKGYKRARSRSRSPSPTGVRYAKGYKSKKQRKMERKKKC